MVWDGLWFWFRTFGPFGMGYDGLIQSDPRKKRCVGTPLRVHQWDLGLEAKKGVVVAKMDVTAS